MFWQEEKPQPTRIPDDVVDVLFSIQCRTLPVDHAHLLAEALRSAVPWITEDERIGVHTVHVAGSQNGWERPDPSLGQQLHLSRRTKLTIRAPREHVERLQGDLVGVTLEIGGNALVIGDAKTRLLSRQGTIFARYIVLQEGESDDENRFMQRVVADLADRGVRVRKALCGKTTDLLGPGGVLATRSLMLADLPQDESLQLQREGYGPLRQMGCGIFIPHKGIEAVKKSDDD
jgi:CRISPR-associated protein Cas6